MPWLPRTRGRVGRGSEVTRTSASTRACSCASPGTGPRRTSAPCSPAVAPPAAAQSSTAPAATARLRPAGATARLPPAGAAAVRPWPGRRPRSAGAAAVRIRRAWQPTCFRRRTRPPGARAPRRHRPPSRRPPSAPEVPARAPPPPRPPAPAGRAADPSDPPPGPGPPRHTARGGGGVPVGHTRLGAAHGRTSGRRSANRRSPMPLTCRSSSTDRNPPFCRAVVDDVLGQHRARPRAGCRAAPWSPRSGSAGAAGPRRPRCACRRPPVAPRAAGAGAAHHHLLAVHEHARPVEPRHIGPGAAPRPPPGSASATRGAGGQALDARAPHLAADIHDDLARPVRQRAEGGAPATGRGTGPRLRARRSPATAAAARLHRLGAHALGCGRTDQKCAGGEGRRRATRTSGQRRDVRGSSPHLACTHSGSRSRSRRHRTPDLERFGSCPPLARPLTARRGHQPAGTCRHRRSRNHTRTAARQPAPPHPASTRHQRVAPGALAAAAARAARPRAGPGPAKAGTVTATRPLRPRTGCRDRAAPGARLRRRTSRPAAESLRRIPTVRAAATHGPAERPRGDGAGAGAAVGQGPTARTTGRNSGTCL